MECLRNVDLLNKIVRFTNAYIVKDESLVYGDLWVYNGKIIDGLKLFFREKLGAHVTVNLRGNVISPGFIDLQINGGYGYNFSDSTANIRDACRKVASKLPETGVTSFCPTIISLDKTDYALILPQFVGYENLSGAAKVIGVHLEGPFLSQLRAGMHDTTNLLEFGEDVIKTITDTYGSDLSMVSMVTVAPELSGSGQAVDYFVSNGISVSMGHTNADCDTLEKAVSCGARFVTHLFNAMPLFHHREAHIFGSIVSPKPALHVGVIADLVHVHPAALRVADAIAPGRVVLITDGNTAFGLPDGLYSFGRQTIDVTDGIAYLPGTKCLAGGTTPLSTCMQNYWLEVTYQNHILQKQNPGRTSLHHSGSINTECVGRSPWPGLGEALAAASSRPARGLGLMSQKNEEPAKTSRFQLIGRLEPGFVADFIILSPFLTDNNHIDASHGGIHILSTWINGRPVYDNSTFPPFRIDFCLS